LRARGANDGVFARIPVTVGRTDMATILRRMFAIGAASVLLFGAGATASADEMTPAPGDHACERCLPPQVLLPPPPEDIWVEPLIPEQAVDEFIVEMDPPVIHGDLSGIIPLLPPDMQWPDPGH
jgi:hypothetical protein